MLFSRKNAAVVAAFLAPSAYAQTAAVAGQNPASCNSTTLATFNLYAPAGTSPSTIGPLSLVVVADLTQPCTGAGGQAGFLITSLSGSLGQGVTTGGQSNGAGGAITFLPGTGNGGDQCFFPCAAQSLDTSGLTFARNENGNNVAYRYYYSTASTTPGYVLNTAANAGGTQASLLSNQNTAVFNTCKSPTPGAGVCVAGQTCSSARVAFSTITGTDNSGNAFVANVGYNPNQICSVTPAAAGTTNVQGFAVTSISGSFLGGAVALPNTYTAASACYYPCSATVVDPQGIPFTVVNTVTGVASGVYSLSYGTGAGSTTTPAYRVGTTANTATTYSALSGTQIAQSCMASQAAFYSACPVSSSSTTMSSTSASSAVSSSISLPVTLPTSGISTGSLPVTIPTSGVVSVPTSTGVISTASVSTPTGSVIATSSLPSTGVVTVPSSSASGSVTGSPVSSSTRSSTASIATGPQTSVPTPFVITISVSIRKRQAAQYVGAGGVLTTDPTQAAVFNLVNGQLFSNGAIVSTGPAVPAQQPLAGGAQGTITTLWTSNNNAIAWTNAVFANGAATFCVANNVVNTVFVAAPATGCVPVALTQVAQSAVVAPAPSASAAAGGITINNNFNPVIGVYVTVNLTFGTTTLGNGSVITTTGLATTTSPLYANPSGDAYCLKCAMSAIGASCPNSGNTVYTTACGCASTAPAVAVTCPTCVPVTLPAATATAGAAAGATAGASAAAAAGAAAAATAGKTTFTGAASSYGVEAAALVAAGVALLL